MPVFLLSTLNSWRFSRGFLLAALGLVSAGPALAAPAPTDGAACLTEASTRPAGAGHNLKAHPLADGTLSGRIVDGKGQPLPGVTVVVEGTTIGGSTNADGYFSIANVPAGAHTLVISFVGYATVRREFTSGPGEATINATLAESATELGEAVVVGYGTTRRQDVTGAVATVSAREFVQGQVTSPEQLVQGKVAGVQIYSSRSELRIKA